MSSSQARRIFIVEDETLVLMNLEDILLDLGCIIAGQAMRLAEGERLAETITLPDAAILDVNIGGKQVFPIAQILQRRGVPMIFATGYGVSGLPEEWRLYPVIAKPYSRDDVARALQTIAAAPAP